MKTRHTQKRLFLGMLFLGALFICMAAIVPEARAESVKSDSVLTEEIDKLIGGWVCVTLNSGATFCGKAMKTRAGLVHLAKVEGKEYSDVLVRISDISVLGGRFRAKKKDKKEK